MRQNDSCQTIRIFSIGIHATKRSLQMKTYFFNFFHDERIVFGFWTFFGNCKIWKTTQFRRNMIQNRCLNGFMTLVNTHHSDTRVLTTRTYPQASTHQTKRRNFCEVIFI